jgi:hypothetical protein
MENLTALAPADKAGVAVLLANVPLFDEYELQRWPMASPFTEIFSPSNFAFHGGNKIDELCSAHSAMCDRTLGHCPICEIAPGFFETS